MIDWLRATGAGDFVVGIFSLLVLAFLGLRMSRPNNVKKAIREVYREKYGVTKADISAYDGLLEQLNLATPGWRYTHEGLALWVEPQAVGDFVVYASQSSAVEGIKPLIKFEATCYFVPKVVEVVNGVVGLTMHMDAEYIFPMDAPSLRDLAPTNSARQTPEQIRDLTRLLSLAA